MQPSDSVEAGATDEGVLMLAYFDGDRPVFRAASAPLDDEAIRDEDSEFSGAARYGGAIPRDISYEIEDEEPVYRSLGGLQLGDDAPLPEPPSLSRQRGFGQPGLVD